MGFAQALRLINIKASHHLPEAFFVPCADIKSICRRLEVANDVISGTDDMGAKSYHLIQGFMGLALTVFSHCTSVFRRTVSQFPGGRK